MGYGILRVNFGILDKALAFSDNTRTFAIYDTDASYISLLVYSDAIRNTQDDPYPLLRGIVNVEHLADDPSFRRITTRLEIHREAYARVLNADLEIKLRRNNHGN